MSSALRQYSFWIIDKLEYIYRLVVVSWFHGPVSCKFCLIDIIHINIHTKAQNLWVNIVVVMGWSIATNFSPALGHPATIRKKSHAGSFHLSVYLVVLVLSPVPVMICIFVPFFSNTTSLVINVQSSCNSRHGCRRSFKSCTLGPSDTILGWTYGTGAVAAEIAEAHKTIQLRDIIVEGRELLGLIFDNIFHPSFQLLVFYPPLSLFASFYTIFSFKTIAKTNTFSINSRKSD